jgi:type I restriction enzyme S subunit
MAELRTIRISDLGRVVTGKTPPSARPELFGDLHPFLTPTDIDGFARYIEPGRFLSPEGCDYQHRLMLPERAVCVVCIGATIGKVCMTAHPSFTNQQINSVVVNEKEHDPFFVFHLLTTLSDELKSNAGGAATPIINKTAFSEIAVSVPPLPVQRRIAGILSGYDEQIENSQRRIRTLEAMARVLYREWFVNFRFPGHKKLPLVASPIGEIPKGWDGRFSDLSTIIRDSINPFEFPSEAFEHFSIPAFDDGRQPAIELGKTILSGKYCIDDSCVLLSKLNPRIPRVWLPIPSGQRRAVTSTEFLVLRPQPGVTREFIYTKCCSEMFAEQFVSLAIGTSTSHQRVKPENLLAMPSTVPDKKVIEQFTKLVSPMLSASQQLRSQIQNLRQTRDLLLPRLLSGQVSLLTN